MSVRRRNTCTAVLFLCSLFAATLYLGFGLLSDTRGFQETARPGRSVRTTKAVILARAAEENKKLPPLTRTPTRILRHSLGTPLPSYSDAVDSFARFTQDSDPTINALLDRDHIFIELHGAVQQLMGRRVVEDPDPQYTVVRLEDGLLSFANLEQEPELETITNRAREMILFSRRVNKKYKVPFLYVQAPSKLNVSTLPDGVPDYSDAEADLFLALLRQEGVDTLDLRPVFEAAAKEDPQATDELFFHTDHHWTPKGAFLGYQALCEKLQKRYRFKIKEELTDPDCFDTFLFQDVFLGSQGRRVGSSYAGLDDMEIWSPKFSTSFTYSAPLLGVQREGPFVVSLLFPERLANTDLYAANPYTIYAGGDYLLSRAVNKNAPEGKRVLILRDSFGCGLTPFLSLACGEVIAMDPRQFNGNQDMMLHYVDWLEPDLIIVLNTTGSLRVDKLYPYLPTARANALEQKRTEEN